MFVSLPSQNFLPLWNSFILNYIFIEHVIFAMTCFIYLFIWQLQWRSYSILSKKTVSPLLMYFQEWIGEDKSFCGCYQLDTRRKRFTKDKSKSVTLVVQLCSKRWELSNTKTLLKNISTISCREKATANTYQTGKHYN